GRIALVAMYGAEAPAAIRVQVELGLAPGHPLRQRSPDSARAAEAVEREPGGQVQAADARHRAEQRIGVGRHRVWVADELDDPRVAEEREPARGAAQERLEPRLVGR